MRQYTLGDIFLWTTVIGLVVALYRLDQLLPERMHWVSPTFGVLLPVAFAILSLILGRSRPKKLP
jgi:hypothetical protein